MDIDIIRKTLIPRFATFGLKWREEVVKDGALGQSGEPAASPVVWASRPGDVQVGEVGRCKVGERWIGREIFWTKGKQTSPGKESVLGLAEHRSPCLGMWLASRCFKPNQIKISKIFLSSATERSAVFRIVTMVLALQW